MEDQVTKAPAWAYYVAGAVLVLLPSLYGLSKLYFWVQGELRKKRKADDELEDAQRRTASEDVVRAATQVNAELTARVQSLSAEVSQLRGECAQCHAEHAQTRADHAGTKALLKIVALWAQKKGMPVTPELERIIKEDSSHPHKPLSAEAKQ